ncbi:MAG: glycosyltransferase [Pseudomonadales bacterium]|nr:glycosyltransferase [Pseudomonadales bacterium]MBO7004754.1 glycosyltransferase [Pseudomonadales bacterium]
MTPRVSIIIPCRDHGDYIERALRSCDAQTHPNKELIVVDDGSVDGSEEVIRSVQRDISTPLKIISGSGTGPGAARNLGLDESTGHYIQWLDADDLIEPQKIEQQLKVLEKSEADIAYGPWKTRRYQRDFVHYYEDQNGQYYPDVLEALIKGNWFAVHATLCTRSMTQEILWDEELPVLEDADYWLRAAAAGMRFEYTGMGDQAIYCRYGIPSRNEMSRDWLRTRLEINRKPLSLLDSERHRHSIAMGFLGTSEAAYTGRQFDIARTAMSEAVEMVSNEELRVLTRERVGSFGSLGGMGLALVSVFRGIRASARTAVMNLFGMDENLSLKENLGKRTSGST